jgi:hypothetical protein
LIFHPSLLPTAALQDDRANNPLPTQRNAIREHGNGALLVHAPPQPCIAKSFTIDGEAVVLEPDGLSRFEELSRRDAARTAILYAFDLIEHWIKVRNPASIAVQRERSEIWDRRALGSARRR